MNYAENPFQELYVADTPSLEHFVKLFSKVPMTSLSVIQPLFQASNVVLVGTQGCGKTMLLNLLRPDIRVAYFKYKEQFPVEAGAADFISGGVNLTKTALPQLAEVSLGEGAESDAKELPYYFADFFNYLIIKDLLENIQVILGRPDVFGPLIKEKKIGTFTHTLIEQDCWFGALKGCNTLNKVRKRVEKRLACYRLWVSLNIRQKGAPPLLRDSKTAIGEPILRFVHCLKCTDVISDKLPIFIRVDQLEILHQNPPGRKSEVHLAFRRMINAAIGRRDLRVAYRLGCRRWGWDNPEFLTIHGTGGRLEERRDFIQIDIDEALRRKENKQGRFEYFANDAFSRRISYYLSPKQKLPKLLLKQVFGKSPTQQERAEYFGKSLSGGDISIRRALGIEAETEAKQWSAGWLNFLLDLYKRNPLDAVLAAAWARQKGGRGGRDHRHERPPAKPPYPWQRIWWRKERLMIAVLQLAARRQQRLLWSGCEDILGLSGGNISAFIHICHEIWDQFLKEERPKPEKNRIDPLSKDVIDKLTQAVGIQNASSVWYRKLAEQPGGDIRRRFIERLGSNLRKRLREDKSMSYPGGNGFSISVVDLEAKRTPNREVWQFLREAVGYGDLIAAEHTTKEKSGKQRLKFYLNPILSPVFQVPVAHTKEPLYWKIEDVMQIAREAELPFTFDSSIGVANREDKRLKSDESKQLRFL